MTLTFLYPFIMLSLAVGSVDAQRSPQGGIDRPCPSGTSKVVEYIQPYRADPYQPEIYMTSCVAPSASQSPISANDTHLIQGESSLQRRQSTPVNLCNTECANWPFCWLRTPNVPTANDCNDVVNYLKNRNLNQVVQSGKELIVKSGTCTTSFTHHMSAGTATWCDQTWANQLEGLIQACLPKGQWAFCSPTGMELLYFFNEDALATSAIPSNTVPATTPAATTSSNALPSATSVAQSTANAATSSAAATTTPITVPLPSQSQTSSVTDDTSPPVGSNTTDSSTLPSSPSPSSSSPAPATENRNSKTNTAVAIGAAIGAVAALLLIVAGFWIWRRRNQREKETLSLVEEEDQHEGTQTMGQMGGAVWQPASAAVAAKYASGSPRRFATAAAAAAYSSHSLTAPLTQPDVSTSDGTESSEGGGLAPHQQPQQQQQLTEAEISRLADGLVAHMLMAPPEYENAVRGNRSANPGGTNLQPPPLAPVQ